MLITMSTRRRGSGRRRWFCYSCIMHGAGRFGSACLHTSLCGTDHIFTLTGAQRVASEGSAVKRPSLLIACTGRIVTHRVPPDTQVFQHIAACTSTAFAVRGPPQPNFGYGNHEHDDLLVGRVRGVDRGRTVAVVCSTHGEPLRERREVLAHRNRDRLGELEDRFVRRRTVAEDRGARVEAPDLDCYSTAFCISLSGPGISAGLSLSPVRTERIFGRPVDRSAYCSLRV